MKNFKAHFKRDASYTSHLASLALTLAFAFHAFAGVGVTKKQLDRTVSEINSNMSAAVSAEIGRNVDSYVDEITLRAIAGATNFLPSFIEGLGQFAEASRFSLLEFDENSLVFDDSYMSNGVFVSRSHKAYFKASWVCPTNKGFTVASSSYPGIPAGTMFAIDEIPVAHTNHPMRVVNATGASSGQLVWNRHLIHNADMFTRPLELLWCEWRYDGGMVDTNRIISESALYDAEIGKDVQSSTTYLTSYKMEVNQSIASTSPNWVNPPSEETHIVTLTDIDGVFRMAVVDSLAEGGRILGTFTLVPSCLTDAEAHAARNGTPKVSALTRLWRSVKALVVPEAVADRYCQVFGADQGVPSFRITWTDENGEELGVTSLPVSRTPPKKRVNDRGEEHDTDEMYVPCPWYTLADWCKVENWVSFPTSYAIYYADALGRYETEKGVRYSVSNRQMNLSTFKALFLDHAGSLKSLYVYPRRVEKRDPCKEGRHSYVHCVCSVCGKQREHEFIDYGDCKRCGREESIFTVDENNEIVEEPGSRSACGFVPDGEEYHGGWHGVGEEIDDAGNRRYCGCFCGHYSDSNERYFPLGYEGNRAGGGLMHLVLDHLFEMDANDVEWEPGDGYGNDDETTHHATLYCLREEQLDKTSYKVTESHKFYNDDGTYNCRIEGAGHDDYHLVVGMCVKCSQETESMDLHRRKIADAGEMGACVCVGGVNFPDTPGCGEQHHLYVWTACGELRCLYCLSLDQDSPHLAESEHTGPQPPGVSAGDKIVMAGHYRNMNDLEAGTQWGYVLRANSPDAKGHWCGCGLVQMHHQFVEDPETRDLVCPDVNVGNEWWTVLGCGWTEHHVIDESDFDTTISCKESRGGTDGLRSRVYRISSFVWNPDEGGSPPTPDLIWPDKPDRPSSLPPLTGEHMDLSPTVVDFTYQTEISSEWDSLWEFKEGRWKRKWWRIVGDIWNMYRNMTPIFFTGRKGN